MPWDLYWTIIVQVLLALLILALPTGVFVLAVRSAFRSGSKSSGEKLL